MHQKLAVTGIGAVREVEPAIFEIELKLEGGDFARLRLNVLALQELAAKLEHHRLT